MEVTLPPTSCPALSLPLACCPTHRTPRTHSLSGFIFHCFSKQQQRNRGLVVPLRVSGRAEDVSLWLCGEGRGGGGILPGAFSFTSLSLLAFSCVVSLCRDCSYDRHGSGDHRATPNPPPPTKNPSSSGPLYGCISLYIESSHPLIRPTVAVVTVVSLCLCRNNGSVPLPPSPLSSLTPPPKSSPSPSHHVFVYAVSSGGRREGLVRRRRAGRGCLPVARDGLRRCQNQARECGRGEG